MLGDIHDADVKPPDDVLFICKLNPITRADDLDIIFSRFGECRVELVTDYVTGDSLCYGFVEFRTEAACQEAYFKMNNVLVDERRIKVDFSQSVSGLWNKFRRKEKMSASDADGGGGGGAGGRGSGRGGGGIRGDGHESDRR